MFILIDVFLISVIIFLIIVLLLKNSNSEFDGEMIVEKREDETLLATLALGTDPELLLNKDRVVFKVVQKEDSHI